MHLQRQRYILFKVITFNSKTTIKQEDILKAVWYFFQRLFGDYNAYKMGLWMVSYDENKGLGILHCNNVTKEMLISTLCFITQINNNPVIIHTIKTAGTIKKIKKIISSLEE